MGPVRGIFASVGPNQVSLPIPKKISSQLQQILPLGRYFGESSSEQRLSIPRKHMGFEKHPPMGPPQVQSLMDFFGWVRKPEDVLQWSLGDLSLSGCDQSRKGRFWPQPALQQGIHLNQVIPTGDSSEMS